MKRFFVIAVVVCLAVSLMAKELPKQGFGLQIGWAQPILRVNSNTSMDTLHTTKLNGFKVGVVYDASIIAGFGTSIGINYTMAGGHTNWTSKSPYTVYPRTRVNTMYHEVELFVDWQYKFEVAKETYLMLYTGPTIQCGIAYNTTELTESQTITGDIQPSYVLYDRYTINDANEQLKRLNVTWGVGAGFQYKRYFVRGGYDFGLIVPYKSADFVNGNHTRGRLDQWNIKVGVYLWYDED